MQYAAESSGRSHDDLGDYRVVDGVVVPVQVQA